MIDLDAHLPQLVAGDPQAFARWIAGAEPSLRSSLRSFARSVDTEAVLQESLLRLWQVAPKFVPDGRPNGLLRLAIRIGKNAAIDEIRRQRVDTFEEEILERMKHEADEPQPVEPDFLLRAAIARCREKLPEKPAAALQQRMFATEPDEVLAERLQMKLNTFLQNITRARTLLAECLRKAGVEIEGAR